MTTKEEDAGTARLKFLADEVLDAEQGVSDAARALVVAQQMLVSARLTFEAMRDAQMSAIPSMDDFRSNKKEGK